MRYRTAVDFIKDTALCSDFLHLFPSLKVRFLKKGRALDVGSILVNRPFNAILSYYKVSP
jgi:hypothetical protein